MRDRTHRCGLTACETQTEFETFLADAEKREARQQALRAKHSEDGRHGTDQAHDGEGGLTDEAMLAPGWSMIDEALAIIGHSLKRISKPVTRPSLGWALRAQHASILTARKDSCNSQMKTCQRAS